MAGNKQILIFLGKTYVGTASLDENGLLMGDIDPELINWKETKGINLLEEKDI